VVLDCLTILDHQRLARAGWHALDSLDRLDFASISRVARHGEASTQQRIQRQLSQVSGEA